MENSEELLPVVNKSGEVTGSASRGECHDGVSFLLHPVVHLHIVNREGKILSQKRSMNKKIQPGKWDTAVGGHVDFGETVSEALRREAEEETGFANTENALPVKAYCFRSEVEAELINPHVVFVGDDFMPRTKESDQIDEFRFFSEAELSEMASAGLLTPNFASELSDVIFPFLKSIGHGD